jgi:DNA polymerase-3 subunit delta'
VNVLIHDRARRQVEDLVSARQGSYIFHGPRGMGKRTMAQEVSRRLNCLGDSPKTCTSCLQHAAGNYPDLLVLERADKAHIQVEETRALLNALSLSLYHPSGVRVVIIDDADIVTVQAQNALLKVIEEPPAQTIFVLITSRPTALLSTIHSRCAHIYFPPLTQAAIEQLLISDLEIAPSDASTIALLSDGAPGTAVALAGSPELLAERLSLDELARVVVAKNLFERLLLAKRLTDAKSDVVRFGRLVHQRIIAQSRATDTYVPELPRRTEALERFRRAVESNVAPRVALERLMLEL